MEIIFSSDEFWALVFLVSGFALGEGARLIRESYKNRKLKAALRDELEANLYRIPQVLDVINQITKALADGSYVPGTVVPSLRNIYEAHYPEIAHKLSPRERDSIHMIYSRLEIVDTHLEGFERNFKDDVAGDLIDDPFQAHTALLQNISDVLRTSAKMIERFLADKPVDVFYRHDKGGKLPGRFVPGVAKPDSLS